MPQSKCLRFALVPDSVLVQLCQIWSLSDLVPVGSGPCQIRSLWDPVPVGSSPCRIQSLSDPVPVRSSACQIRSLSNLVLVQSSPRLIQFLSDPFLVQFLHLVFALVVLFLITSGGGVKTRSKYKDKYWT